MDPDELFDQYIEFDDGTESEETNTMRQPNTTKTQFHIISAFMEGSLNKFSMFRITTCLSICVENNEELIDKETFALLWVDLAARLNDIGPPDHTVLEWKKIWSS